MKNDQVFSLNDVHDAILVIFACALSLTGCIQLAPAPTPSPSAAPVTPTATVFFPTLIPSPTVTPIPTGSPTPDLSANLGETIFVDNFSADLGWVPVELAPGGVSRSGDRLTLSVRQANSLFMAISPAEPIQNAYLEVEMRPELCLSNDEFGLVFRINQDFEHYRFTLTCQGEARVVGVIQGVERVLIPSTSSTAIFPGLFLSNRLGIWMEGDSFRFFINGEEIFSDRDPSLMNGHVGLVVRARQSGQTTASFDNFILRTLPSTPTSTRTD
ncbi:MAG: hypothetical protein E4G99_02640 [Anaerolineales bacterium]|nr:MAG: hypothetical protein E4G99_02640 [Anaerolineales bacterium]